MSQISDFDLQNLKISFNVRPLKFAYFFRDDDVQAFDHVVRYLSTQWGGIRNWLIPVPSDLEVWPLFKEFLTIHQPDRFISYLPADIDTAALQIQLQQLFPAVDVQLWHGHHWENQDHAAHPLAIHPGRAMVSPDGGQDKSKPTIVAHSASTADDVERRVLLTLFGAIYNGQEERYRDAFDIKHVPASFQNENIWHQQTERDPFGSVINLTGYGVQMRQVVAPWDGLEYYLLVANDVPGLCIFWNYRAEREAAETLDRVDRRVLLLPPSKCNDKELLAGLLRLIRTAPIVPNASSDLDLLVDCFDDATYKCLKEHLAEINGVEILAKGKIGVQHWSGYPDKVPREADRDRTLRCLFGHRPLSDSYKEGFGSPPFASRVSLDFGANELAFKPPDGFRNTWGGSTAVDLSSDVWRIYPRDHAVSSKIFKNAWFSPYGLSAELFTPSHATYLPVALPRWWDAVAAYFARRGYEIRMSPPGQYCNALISLIGGLREASAFASSIGYRVLDALALKSSKKVAQRILQKLTAAQVSEEELARILRDAEVVPELKRVPKTLEQLRPFGEKRELLALLERLSVLKVIKRGFHVTCPTCLMATWHPLHSLDESLTCPGCSTTFVLPVEHSVGAGVELTWEYTLNSLVNRVMDQDALLNVLAVYHETKPNWHLPFVPGLELIAAGQPEAEAEFDYFYVNDQQLFAGECKVGTELAGKDIKAARLAATLGVKRFSFCTVRRFSKEAMAQVDSFRADVKSSGSTMEVMVLSGDDLLGGCLI